MLILRGQITVDTVDGTALVGNRPGDPTRRRVPIYLPPSYDAQHERRYPTIYMLNGFTLMGLSFLNSQWRTLNLPERVDDLMTRGEMEEAIIVMTDGMTRYGGSHFIDSRATGKYQTFLAEDIVRHVDANYRTLPRPESRAVVGRSMGGYGALMAGMQRQDVFSAVGCHSGDVFFERCFGPLICDAVNMIHRHGSLQSWLDYFDDHVKLRGPEFTTAGLVAMASCWSPDLEGDGDGCGFWLPFEPASGQRRETVMAQWRNHDPLFMPDHVVETLGALRTLYIDCGDADEYHLHVGARLFSERLTGLGVAHRYDEYHDGHRDTSYRYDVSLPLISTALARD